MCFVSCAQTASRRPPLHAHRKTTERVVPTSTEPQELSDRLETIFEEKKEEAGSIPCPTDAPTRHREAQAIAKYIKKQNDIRIKKIEVELLSFVFLKATLL